MKLDDLVVYQMAMGLGEQVWALTTKWDRFARDTIGRQLTRSADSVAANVSEGYGRYHYRENRQFCYYARGSLYETRTWLTKAHHRNLIDTPQHQALMRELETLSVKLNNYIKTIAPPRAQPKK